MTKEQEVFFKNSVIKFPVYHSTDSDFTVFNEGRLLWFAQDKFYAEEWFGDHNHILECYINLTNPFRLDKCGDINDWFFDEDVEWPDTFVNFEDDTVYQLPLTDTVKRIAERLGITEKEIVDMFVLQGYCDMNYIYYLTNSEEFAKLLRQKGYDGVIADEGGFETLGVLNANQVKLVSNTSPTNSNDITEDFESNIYKKIYDNLVNLGLDVYKDSPTEISAYDDGPAIREFKIKVLPDKVQFESIHIDSTYQHQGIGEKLVKAVLDSLPKGYTVYVHNSINDEFWNHMKNKYTDYNWTGIQPLTESSTTNNILDDLDKTFGQDELYMWSTYILPNGHFLNPDNAPEYFDKIGEDPAYEHCDFEDYAFSKGYHLNDIYDNCCKMNVTLPYISMPDKAKPTQEQLNAVRKAIASNAFQSEGKFLFYDTIRGYDPDKLDKMGNNLLAIYTPVGDEIFDLDVSSPDDIIKAINMAYVRGHFMSEALTEDSDYDWDSRTSYEYNTGAVNGDDIFDTTTLGGFSDLSQCIPGNKYYQYMIDEKNKKGEIKMLSPEEYYEICAAQFGTTPEDLKQGRSTPPEYIKALERVITVKKKKFPMPFIDYTEKGSQEGLHRMMAAGNLFGWDHKFPVLVIDWADKARHEKEVDDDRRWELERNIDRALENALLYTYTSTEEFQSQLQEELNTEINGRYSYEPDVKFTLHLDNPKSSITVDDVTVEFDTNRIEVDPDRNYDDIELPELDDIEDIDLDEKVLKNYLQK